MKTTLPAGWWPALPLASLRPALSPRAQDLLKALALCCLTLEHVQRLALQHIQSQHIKPMASVLGTVGPFAFALFALLIAYNIQLRQVSPQRYLAPLLLFAVLSQPPYLLLFGPTTLNPLFTLFLGVALCAVLDVLPKHLTPTMLPVVATIAFPTVLLSSIPCTYPLLGPLLVPVARLLLARPRLPTILLWVLASFLAFGASPWALPAVLSPVLFFALPTINGGRLFKHRALVYVFSPAHLFVLAVIAVLLGQRLG